MGNNMQFRQLRCLGCIPSADVVGFDSHELNIGLDSNKPKGKITAQSTVYLNVDEVNLFKAAAGRNISLIRFFVSRGVNINTLDEERTSILHVAARHGSIPVVEELIQSNANLNLTDMAGWTPLHVAAFFSRAQVCQILLSAGADSELRARDGLQARDLVRDKMTLEVFNNLVPVQHTEEQDIYCDRQNRQRESAQHQFDLYFRNLKRRLSSHKLSSELSPSRYLSNSKHKSPESSEKQVSVSLQSISIEVLSLITLVSPLPEMQYFSSKHSPLLKELVVLLAATNVLLGLAFAILTHQMKPQVEDAISILRILEPSQLGQLFTSKLMDRVRLMDVYLSATPYESDEYIRSLRGFFSCVACPNDPFQLDCLVEGLSRHLIRNVRMRPFRSESALHMFTFAVLVLDIELNEKRGKAQKSRLERAVQDFLNNIQGTNDGGNYEQQFLNMIIDETRRLKIANIQQPQQATLDQFRCRLNVTYAGIPLVTCGQHKQLWELYRIEVYLVLVREDKVKVLIRESVTLECNQDVILRPRGASLLVATTRQLTNIRIKHGPILRFRLCNLADMKRLIYI